MRDKFEQAFGEWWDGFPPERLWEETEGTLDESDNYVLPLTEWVADELHSRKKLLPENEAIDEDELLKERFPDENVDQPRVCLMYYWDLVRVAGWCWWVVAGGCWWLWVAVGDCW